MIAYIGAWPPAASSSPPPAPAPAPSPAPCAPSPSGRRAGAQVGPGWYP
eukprot:CAMPEP_0119129330 /NCGR_PEP_ID=MMETSP1310-20130426/7127_1 /TAXON_ID=464262 /ORGANISM="Genus nov. species nov., Strain RCC2339" /LENGTH=48 /DNA_ID= /DNA_START= /DNA_END= /DNA_ORIENTATION=